VIVSGIDVILAGYKDFPRLDLDYPKTDGGGAIFACRPFDNGLKRRIYYC
jgi:hypothetical protein